MSLRSSSPLLPLLLAAFVGLPGPLCADPAPTAAEVKAKAKAGRAAAQAALARVKREVDGRAPAALEKEILRDLPTLVEYLTHLGKPRIPELEQALLTDARVAADYAEQVLRARWPEAEPIILRDWEATTGYAWLIGGRWPEGEATLCRKVTGSLVHYCSDVAKMRVPTVETAILSGGNAEVAMQYAHRVIHGRWPEAEVLIRRDASAAASYAAQVLHARWPEAEAVIATKGTAAASYAMYVLRARWPEAEAVILRSPEGGFAYVLEFLKTRNSVLEATLIASGDAMQCYEYASQVVGGAWPESEPVIARDECWAFEYAGLIGRRFPAGEAAILRAPYRAGRYAAEVLKARWPEAEPGIMKEPQPAVYYACDVIRGRFPEAEAVIATDAWCSVKYARERLSGRFLAGEPAILCDTGQAVEYAECILKARWPEAESAIRRDAWVAAQYAEKVIKARWPEAEPAILKSRLAAISYATRVLKHRWPEAEPLIFSATEDLFIYEQAFPDAVAARGAVDPESALALALRKGLRDADAERLIRKSPRASVTYAKEIIKGRWSEAEADIAADPAEAMRYAREVIGARWPEAEPTILRSTSAGREYLVAFKMGRNPAMEAALLTSRDSYSCFRYAGEVVKGAWPEAGPVIARDAGASVAYAKLIGRRFVAGEPSILADGTNAVEYAREVLKARWPEAEPIISKSAWAAVPYAREVIKGPFPEAEPVIATMHYPAMEYAKTVLKGRFAAAEPLLITHRELAMDYAVSALGHRWLEAEPLIFSKTDDLDGYDKAFPDAVAVRTAFDPGAALHRTLQSGVRDAALERVIARSAPHAVEYAQRIVKGRWPEGEPAILASPYRASEYAETVIKGRWPEAEAILATKPLAALHYARCVLKARWPAGEAAILTEPGLALIYAAEVLNARWPEAEAVIASDPRSAVGYAVLVINGRWPEAEPAIFKSKYAVDYAMRVLRRRIPEREVEIFSEPRGNREPYLRSFFTKPDEAFEALLLSVCEKKNTEDTYIAPLIYAECARRSRWPEAEPYILRLRYEYQLQYFDAVFAGERWPAYEEIVRKQPADVSGNHSTFRMLFEYAQKLRRGVTLPEDLGVALFDHLLGAHGEIHSTWPYAYHAGTPSPAFESRFLASAGKFPQKRTDKEDWKFNKLMELGWDYSTRVRGAKWPEFEKLLPGTTSPRIKDSQALIANFDTEPADFPRALSRNEADDAKLSRSEAHILFENPSRAVRYARDVIKGRWPELEAQFLSAMAPRAWHYGTRPDSDFLCQYTGESGRTNFGTGYRAETVGAVYLREVVHGPLPALEPELAKDSHSVLVYAEALRREFPAGEPVLLDDSQRAGAHYHPARDYIHALLGDPGATADFVRLFKGPQGRRWCREALRGESVYGEAIHPESFDYTRSNEAKAAESALYERVFNRE